MFCRACNKDESSYLQGNFVSGKLIDAIKIFGKVSYTL